MVTVIESCHNNSRGQSQRTEPGLLYGMSASPIAWPRFIFRPCRGGFPAWTCTGRLLMRYDADRYSGVHATMAHDDIVIVGGGIIGVCTAFCLLSHPSFPASGVSVTLVERTSAIASQASGKAGGFLAKDWHGPATSELAESSWALHLEWAERYGGRERWGFRRMTSLGVDLDLGASTGERRPQGNPAFEESELRQKPASKGSPKSEGVGAWIAEGAKKTVLGTEDTTAQV